MAGAIGKPPSTVQSWIKRGSIPDQHKLGIMEAAQEIGLRLQPEDFFPCCMSASVTDEKGAA